MNRKYLILAFMSCIMSMMNLSCAKESEGEASLWILHDAEAIANLEVYLDDEFVVEVAPGEQSVPVGTSLGDHTLTLRSSGNTNVLLTHELTDLKKRASVIVVYGDAQNLKLLEATQRLPDVNSDEHMLEIIDLSGLSTKFSLLLSGQDEVDFEECTPLGSTFTCHVKTFPLEGDQKISELIKVRPGSNMSISTDHLGELLKVDLLGGEVTTIVIRSPSEEMISLRAFRATL